MRECKKMDSEIFYIHAAMTDKPAAVTSACPKAAEKKVPEPEQIQFGRDAIAEPA
jgi:hypothetical protein